MKVTKLEVSNFKRISVVEIEPKGGAVVIAGRNAQGKSSVLDAIDALLRGGKAFPAIPVRAGEKRASLRCELDDGIVIERGITGAGATTLKITTADGMSPQSPQAWLDRKLSAATCDPLAFLRMKPQDQAAELRRLVGADTTAIDEERAAVYAQRTMDGRQLHSAEGALSGVPSVPQDTPDESVSAFAIAAELDAARGAEDKRDVLLGDAQDLDRDAAGEESGIALTTASAQSEAEELRNEAARLRGEADRLEKEAENTLAQAKRTVTVLAEDAMKGRAKAELRRMEAAGIIIPDMAAIRARLAAVDTINRNVREKQRFRETGAQVSAWSAKVAAGTKALEALDQRRAAILRDAAWPLPGLGIDDAGRVAYGGVPIEQASQAEQIRIGLALALAGKPEIRVALIREGSHLDEDGLAALGKAAEEADAQVWIERVGSLDAGAVVIEDGTVATKENLP